MMNYPKKILKNGNNLPLKQVLNFVLKAGRIVRVVNNKKNDKKMSVITKNFGDLLEPNKEYNVFLPYNPAPVHVASFPSDYHAKPSVIGEIAKREVYDYKLIESKRKAKAMRYARNIPKNKRIQVSYMPQWSEEKKKAYYHENELWTIKCQNNKKEDIVYEGRQDESRKQCYLVLAKHEDGFRMKLLHSYYKFTPRRPRIPYNQQQPPPLVQQQQKEKLPEKPTVQMIMKTSYVSLLGEGYDDDDDEEEDTTIVPHTGSDDEPEEDFVQQQEDDDDEIIMPKDKQKAF